MAKIYQYVRDPDYYMIPLFRNLDRPDMYRSVGVYLSVGEVHWGQSGSRDLAEDERFYKVVGEIDLDEMILDAIKWAIGYEPTEFRERH